MEAWNVPRRAKLLYKGKAVNERRGTKEKGTAGETTVLFAIVQFLLSVGAPITIHFHSLNLRVKSPETISKSSYLARTCSLEVVKLWCFNIISLSNEYLAMNFVVGVSSQDSERTGEGILT